MEKKGPKAIAYEHVMHPFAPVYDSRSEILILGSLPSVKSRERQFYYGHPRNRFWNVLAQIYREEVPVSTGEKRSLLLRHHVALWDVIASCDIAGSADSSIRNVAPNDIRGILEKISVRKICFNGGKARELFERYCEKPEREFYAGYEMIPLPSTSPANAAFGLERLAQAWKEHMPGAK